jgi:hypothetical protein
LFLPAAPDATASLDGPLADRLYSLLLHDPHAKGVDASMLPVAIGVIAGTVHPAVWVPQITSIG